MLPPHYRQEAILETLKKEIQLAISLSVYTHATNSAKEER
jgi:hypothetical protein